MMNVGREDVVEAWVAGICVMMNVGCEYVVVNVGCEYVVVNVWCYGFAVGMCGVQRRIWSGMVVTRRVSGSMLSVTMHARVLMGRCWSKMKLPML